MKLAIFVAAALFVHALNAKTTDRAWLDGVVQSVQIKHTTTFDPHAAEVDVEIESAQIIYRATLTYKVYKKDMLPFSGVVTQERRRKRTALNVAVGQHVKFVFAGQKGWIIDGNGAEQKLIFRKASAVAAP